FDQLIVSPNSVGGLVKISARFFVDEVIVKMIGKRNASTTSARAASDSKRRQRRRSDSRARAPVTPLLLLIVHPLLLSSPLHQRHPDDQDEQDHGGRGSRTELSALERSVVDIHHNRSSRIPGTTSRH